MVTTKEAAPAVHLNADWQAKYRLRARQLLLQTSKSQQQHQQDLSGKDALVSGTSDLPSVLIVGRSGVGKGSLVNHLLQKRVASVSRFKPEFVQSFDYHGLFSIKEVPGYDGWHDVDRPSHRERFRKHFHRSSHGSCHTSHGSLSDSSHASDGPSSHSSGHGSDNDKGRRLELNEFVEMYGIFAVETKAIVFVVNSRITPDDIRLLELAVENRKFFCIVCTHADSLVQLEDMSKLKHQLKEAEEQLRKDLDLINNLNVRIFIISIPFPEDNMTDMMLEGPDLECVIRNTTSLQFPLLQAYLSEPKGLSDELQIHGFVKEEVWDALESFQNVKKRHQALDFSQQLLAGTLLPIVGPVMVTFIKTLHYTLKACSEVGLIEDADDAMQKVTADAQKHSMAIASKEGLVTAVHDSLIHIFGKIVLEIAVLEVVSTAAETALGGALPLVGPVFSAVHLPHRFKKIAEKLAVKACMLHELWIMQNITGLLGMGSILNNS